MTSMGKRLEGEWRALRGALATLDRQVACVLTLAVLLDILHHHFGDPAFFRAELGWLVPARWGDLPAWGWRFVWQGLLGFVVPVACLRGFFRRRPAAIGLGPGDWRFAGVVAALYLPLIVAGTWWLSDRPDFRAHYPEARVVVTDWWFLFVYELLFLVYWIGWEYLWRGFVLFGTRHRLGYYAVFVQMVPFALRHINKPFPEAVLAVVGGLALGALVWRSRSFWIAVPIHAAQMVCLDLWCTLRFRTGVNGTGNEALRTILFG